MLRRHRRKMIRLLLTALALAGAGAALLPATAQSSRAATVAGVTSPHTAPTPAELDKAAEKAQRTAAAARQAADAAGLTNQRAQASLRQAEAFLADVKAGLAGHRLQQSGPRQQDTYAVSAAESQLQTAQQREQMAEMSVNNANFLAPASGSDGAAGVIIANQLQIELQNARDAVATARQNLISARQTAAAGQLSDSLDTTSTAAQLADAERAVLAARQLANAAAAAAKAAETNAATLAEAANRATAAAARAHQAAAPG